MQPGLQTCFFVYFFTESTKETLHTWGAKSKTLIRCCEPGVAVIQVPHLICSPGGLSYSDFELTDVLWLRFSAYQPPPVITQKNIVEVQTWILHLNVIIAVYDATAYGIYTKFGYQVWYFPIFVDLSISILCSILISFIETIDIRLSDFIFLFSDLDVTVFHYI